MRGGEDGRNKISLRKLVILKTIEGWDDTHHPSVRGARQTSGHCSPKMDGTDRFDALSFIGEG